MHVFKEPKGLSFDRVGVKGKVFPIQSLTKKLEFVLITTEKGHQTTIIEHKCDFVYYVLAGKGHFLINDKKEDCKKGDLIVIPAGTKFTYIGKLKLLLITTPPYTPEQEEVL